jgi:regulator of protease activity HflC (stomatin/prohibitin superfamily)
MLAYLIAAPITYVLHYQRGRLRREGPGLAFAYFRPTTTIVAVPLASQGVPFAFTEITADFQTVTLQGQLTYRVADPRRLAALLDFSIRPNGTYRSDDPEKVPERLVETLQTLARTAVQRRQLREVLTGAEAILAEVLPAARQAQSVTMLGIEILGLAILSIAPTPEIGRALEAQAREALQRGADEAVYARRNAAVEQERQIKESELNTEIAVQEKQRQIRETQINADIAVEERRSSLIERRSENERRDADARAYALQVTLAPLQQVDWRTLVAVTAGGADPKLMIALAFRELAENAAKIGELNVTPDLLKSLIGSGAPTR